MPWPIGSSIIAILITLTAGYIFFRFNQTLKSDAQTDKRAILLKKIKQNGFPDKEVFVSVHDFFDGNNDSGSIGANIYPDPPSLTDFSNVLKEIKKDPRTSELLVRI